MQIKMRTLYAGPRGTYSPGAIIDMNEADAKPLIDGGYAERVDAPVPAKAERAEAPAGETTEQPTASRRGGRTIRRRS